MHLPEGRDLRALPGPAEVTVALLVFAWMAMGLTLFLAGWFSGRAYYRAQIRVAWKQHAATAANLGEVDRG